MTAPAPSPSSDRSCAYTEDMREDVTPAETESDPVEDSENSPDASGLARCYSCQTVLEPVFPHSRTEAGSPNDEALEDEQWDNALVISLEGGYSMFIDPINPDRPDPTVGLLSNYRAVICHDCAHQLCAQVPWLGRLIDPHYSHAHSVRRDWSQHIGWDLPHDCPTCGQRLTYEDATKVCPRGCAL